MLFDGLKAAGLSTAAINWPCTSESTSIDDNFPDVPNEMNHATPRIKNKLDEIGLLKRFEDGGSVVRDEAWTEAACRVIRDRKPRLLALHLLNVDGAHHNHGPKTSPGYTAWPLPTRWPGACSGRSTTLRCARRLPSSSSPTTAY